MSLYNMINSTIERYAVQRITRLLNSKFEYYSSDGELNSKTLRDYVREATNEIVEKAITENIKDIFAKKVAEML